MSRKHYNIEVFRDAERHTQHRGLEPRSGVPDHLPETERDGRADERTLQRPRGRPGLSGGSDHCSDAVIHREKVFGPPHAKYTVGDPLAPILAQGVTVVSRHAHFRFTAATLPISVTKAVVKFEFVTCTLTK